MSFTAPPPELPLELQYEYHLVHNADHPVFVHPIEDGSLKVYYYSDIVPAIHRSAHLINAHITTLEPGHRTVIALLGTADTLTAFSAIMGILRLGHVAFPISPRFSLQVTANLICRVKPAYIMINNESSSWLGELTELFDDNVMPTLLTMPTYEQLFSDGIEAKSLPVHHHRKPDEDTYIVHSSGSSSLYPKTIPCTSKFMLNSANIIDYAPYELTGKIFGLQALELFHHLGLCFLNWAARTGFVMAVLDPLEATSLVPAQAEDIFQNFVKTKPELILASPRLLEVWITDPDKLFTLRTMTVITAGKLLRKVVGNNLSRAGIKINTAYGSTETGPISVLSTPINHDWEYFQVPPIPEFVFTKRTDGLYGLTVLSTVCRPLPVCNTTYAGYPAYDTGDIFTRHQATDSYYQIIGRISDQIMLSTGEIVDPVPTEEQLVAHPAVKAAVLFGHNRDTIGLIIELEDSVQPTESNEQPGADMVADLVWTEIGKINNESTLPNTQIQRKMIIQAQKSKPISLGPKGTPQRALVYKDYEEEINLIYNLV